MFQQTWKNFAKKNSSHKNHRLTFFQVFLRRNVLCQKFFCTGNYSCSENFSEHFDVFILLMFGDEYTIQNLGSVAIESGNLALN
jgi:hypothetical protein